MGLTALRSLTRRYRWPSLLVALALTFSLHLWHPSARRVEAHA